MESVSQHASRRDLSYHYLSHIEYYANSESLTILAQITTIGHIFYSHESSHCKALFLRALCTPRPLRPLEQRSVSTQANMQPSQDLAARSAYTGAASHVVLPEHTGVARGDSFLNTADRIQDQLLEDGHRVWGFVIYRCTYGDDDAWETCLERIHTTVRRHMGFYNALDMLDDFKLTVFDDARESDRAGAHRLREHFNGWRKHAVHEEQAHTQS